MKRFKIMYCLVGIILIVVLIFTSNKGLESKNYELYTKACDMQSDIERNVWKGISIKNYPVAIRKGDTEYVFYKYQVKKRKSILPVYACSIYPVNNEINVLIPSFQELSTIGEIMEGASDGSNILISELGFSKESISEKQYIAIMYHEAFHAYQFSNFKDNLLKISNFKNAGDVTQRIDKSDTLKNLYIKEADILYKAVNEQDKNKLYSYVKQYINARAARVKTLKNQLSSDEFNTLMSAEAYYELFEGTARYVELRTVETFNDKEVYQKYIDGLKDYNGNREKYYKSGMAMCLILDKIDSRWKDNIFSSGKLLYEKFTDDFGGN